MTSNSHTHPPELKLSPLCWSLSAMLLMVAAVYVAGRIALQPLLAEGFPERPILALAVALPFDLLCLLGVGYDLGLVYRAARTSLDNEGIAQPGLLRSHSIRWSDVEQASTRRWIVELRNPSDRVRLVPALYRRGERIRNYIQRRIEADQGYADVART